MSRGRDAPTAVKGAFVVLAGPDGTGKSTLAIKLAEAAGNRALHLHWRPEVLPRLGSLLGREPGDPTTPHARSPHGRVASSFVLMYYWLDFFIGSWLKIWPLVRRGNLVVMERGWFDFAADPRRYRLRIPARLVETLGHLLPMPDVLLVLEAAPEVVMARKDELQSEELARQTARWRQIRLPRRARRIFLDASREAEDLLAVSMRHIDAVRQTGGSPDTRYGWIAVPSPRFARWYLPTSPAQAAKSTLLIYHPVTMRARAGWEVARVLAGLGLLRLIPTRAEVPAAVWETVNSLLPPGGTASIARSNHPGRYFALMVRRDGRLHAFAKLATDGPGAEALQREQRALEALSPRLPPPLYAPRILDEAEGRLILEPIAWRPRLDAWRLPNEVAEALGRFFADTTRGGDPALGAAHGDCAPWNLLRTEHGWTLVDWEDARVAAPAFYDLFHFLVLSRLDLRRPSKRLILRGLELRGWTGDVIRAYARGSGLDPREAKELFPEYLRISTAALDPSNPGHGPGLRIRSQLLRLMSIP